MISVPQILKNPVNPVYSEWFYMRKDLHELAEQLVTITCQDVCHTGKGLRAELRRVNPFDYKTQPYWYRVFLKYRNQAIDRMYEAQAAKQMKLFDENDGGG